MEDTEKYEVIAEEDLRFEIGQRAGVLNMKEKQNFHLMRAVTDDIYSKVRDLKDEEKRVLLDKINSLSRKSVELQCEIIDLKLKLNKGDLKNDQSKPKRNSVSEERCSRCGTKQSPGLCG